MEFLEQLHNFINETNAEYSLINNCYYFTSFNFIIVPVQLSNTNSCNITRSAILEQFAECYNLMESSDSIDILYLYEDRWYSKNRDIKTRIATRLGLFKSIFARKCRVLNGAEWQKDETLVQPDTFAALYHSYGAVKSKYKYALVYNGEVVAAAYFSPSRPMVRLLSSPYKNILPQKRESVFLLNKIVGVAPKAIDASKDLLLDAKSFCAPINRLNIYSNIGIEYNSYEWLRYLSEPNVRVVGAMGRLLKAFIKDNSSLESRSYLEVMSYSDTEWSGGSAYTKLGFVEVQNRAAAEYFVCKESYKRYSAKELLKLYNNTLAESDILSNFYSIKNKGSKKFLLHTN